MASQACKQAAIRSRETAFSFRFFDLPTELQLQILDAYLGIEEVLLIKEVHLCKTSPRIELSTRRCYWCYRETGCRIEHDASAPMSYASHFLPLNLFLTNTWMKTESERIFFSTNLFDFHQRPECTLEFLKCLRPDHLKCFRQMRFSFEESVINSWVLEENKYNTHWQSLIEFIKKELSITCLTVRTFKFPRARGMSTV